MMQVVFPYELNSKLSCFLEFTFCVLNDTYLYRSIRVVDDLFCIIYNVFF